VNVIELDSVDPPPATAVPLPSTAEVRAVTGGVVSTTCTIKLVGVALFPCVSAAVQVTVVLPKGKVDPEAGEHVATPAPSTASEVAGLA
jgi:hypothetical protein